MPKTRDLNALVHFHDETNTEFQRLLLAYRSLNGLTPEQNTSTRVRIETEAQQEIAKRCLTGTDVYGISYDTLLHLSTDEFNAPILAEILAKADAKRKAQIPVPFRERLVQYAEINPEHGMNADAFLLHSGETYKNLKRQLGFHVDSPNVITLVDPKARAFAIARHTLNIQGKAALCDTVLIQEIENLSRTLIKNAPEEFKTAEEKIGVRTLHAILGTMKDVAIELVTMRTDIRHILGLETSEVPAGVPTRQQQRRGPRGHATGGQVSVAAMAAMGPDLT